MEKRLIAYNDEMQSLVDEAIAKGLWFYAGYQDLWFSPRELVQAQADNRFRWGKVNWRLRDPNEACARLSAKLADASAELKAFQARIQKETGGELE